jgi:hypothetical protein
MVGRWVLVVAMSLGGVAAGAQEAVAAGAQEGGAAGSASGEMRVNGRSIALGHAYLFHAPDRWKETEVNAVVLITPQPLDRAKLEASKTLAEAIELAGDHVALEVRAGGGQADLRICHPEFGEGRCYSTTISPPEWSPSEAVAGRVAGSVRTFTGREEEIFQGDYKLFYELRFDAAPVRDFDRRK